jgi:hypothetical protein
MEGALVGFDGQKVIPDPPLDEPTCSGRAVVVTLGGERDPIRSILTLFPGNTTLLAFLIKRA